MVISEDLLESPPHITHIHTKHIYFLLFIKASIVNHVTQDLLHCVLALVFRLWGGHFVIAYINTDACTMLAHFVTMQLSLHIYNRIITAGFNMLH